MERTPEQISADDNLTAAIERTMEAYKLSSVGILTGYVIFTARQGFEADGNGNVVVEFLVKDDGMPWHHIYGLMEMGKFVVDRTRLDSFRSDDDDG